MAVILIFGIFAIGVDVVRIVMVYTNINDEMNAVVMDAMDLNIPENYKADGISYVDITGFQDSFYSTLKLKLNLDNNLERDGFGLFDRMVLEKCSDCGDIIHIDQGQYSTDPLTGVVIMDRYPMIKVQGYVEIKPFILGYLNYYRVPFIGKSENKRYNF